MTNTQEAKKTVKRAKTPETAINRWCLYNNDGKYWTPRPETCSTQGDVPDEDKPFYEEWSLVEDALGTLGGWRTDQLRRLLVHVYYHQKRPQDFQLIEELPDGAQRPIPSTWATLFGYTQRKALDVATRRFIKHLRGMMKKRGWFEKETLEIAA